MRSRKRDKKKRNIETRGRDGSVECCKPDVHTRGPFLASVDVKVVCDGVEWREVEKKEKNQEGKSGKEERNNER